MKDNKLTHKFWARALAFTLFCIAAGAVIVCVYGAMYGYSRLWYEPGHYAGMDTQKLPAGEAWLFANRYSIIYTGLYSGAAALALLIFLMCSAGHREGTEECAPVRQDKIPLEIYLCSASVLALFFVGMGITACSALSDVRLVIFAQSVLWTCLAAVGMAALMTVAARIKAGTLFRNTIVYMAGSRLIGASRSAAGWLKELFRDISLSTRTAAVFAGFILTNALLAVFLFGGSPFALFLLVILNGAALCGILAYAKQAKLILAAGETLASGDLNYAVDTSRLKWDMRKHGENLNSISRGMAKAVEERIKSERFKTELITNVSHDLKTPLTSIITYVDLLQKLGIEDDRAREYINVLAEKSAKLKKLAEDLIDASKASSGAVNVNLERVNLCELMRQSAAEYADRFAAARITPIVNAEGDIYAKADGRLLWRAVDNLLQNICRHGMAGTRAYLSVSRAGGKAVMTFKNISAQQLNIPIEELLERFVQGDESRSGGGSGLGLSIAQSLAELMHGRLRLALDGDLFKSELIFGEDAQ